MAGTEVLNNMEKRPFEELVNQLLWAEFAGRGRFWPNATGEGQNDGGWDAQYTGPWAGVEADWRISVKHTVQKDPVKGLQDLLRGELKRYPGQSCLLATNAVLQPPEQDRLRHWAANREIQLDIIDGNQLNVMLARHSSVAGRFGLSPTKFGVIPARVPVPQTWAEIADQVVAALDDGATDVVLVGPDRGGRTLVLREVAHRLEAAPGRRPPRWITSVEEADALLAEPSDPILFVPDPDLARQIRARDRVVVWTSGEHQASGAIRSFPVAPPEDFEAAEWMLRLSPHLPPEVRAAQFRQSREHPELLVEQPHRVIALVTQNLGWDGPPSLELQARQEMVALLVIATPRLTEKRLAWISGVVGRPPQDVERVLEQAIQQDMLRRRENGAIVLGSELFAAAALQQVGLRRGVLKRLSEEPELAEKLARLGGSESPLLDMLERAQVLIREGSSFDVHQILRHAGNVASWSQGIGERCLELACRASKRIARARSAGETGNLQPEEQMWSWLGSRVADVLRHVLQHTQLVDQACDAFLDLARTGKITGKSSITQFGEAMVLPIHEDPEHAPQGFAWLLGSLRQTPADPTLVELARVAVQPWLNKTVQRWANYGTSVSWSNHPWQEGNPQVQQNRSRALEVLWLLVGSTDPEVRKQGWRAWGGVWAGTARVPAPPDVIRALEDVLQHARERLAEVDDWAERAMIEQRVVWWVGKPELDRDLLAATIRAFRTEPLYQAWRLMSEQQGFVAEPPCLAEQVAAGIAWKDVVGQMSPRHGSEFARHVAARLTAQVKDRTGILHLLSRVDQHKRADAWGHPYVLQLWISADPDLFEPLVLGPQWDRVPPGMRGQLLHAARPAFGDRLTEIAGSVAVSARRLGAMLDLAALLEAPHDADPQDATQLLPVLWEVLPPINRASALLGLAGHSDPNVRHAVLRQLSDWLSFLEPPPDPRDAGEILRGILRAGHGGEPRDEGTIVDAALRTFAHRSDERADLYEGALVVAGPALLMGIGALGYRVEEEDASPILETLSRRIPEAWSAALRESLEQPRRAPVPRDPSPATAMAMLQPLLDEQIPPDREQAWREILEPIARKLDDPGLVALAPPGAPSLRIARLMSTTAPRPTPVYVEALVRALEAAGPHDAEAIEDAVVHLALNRTFDRGGTVELGRALRGAGLDRIADQIDSVANELSQRQRA